MRVKHELTRSSRLTGTRKAAILLAILGEEIASSVYRNLPENDLQMVTKEIAEMGSITADVGQEILEEYSQLALTQDCLAQGGMEVATRLLVKAFGEDTAKNLLQQVVHLQEMSVGQLLAAKCRCAAVGEISRGGTSPDHRPGAGPRGWQTRFRPIDAPS